MSSPIRLTKSYFDRQVARTAAVAAQIRARSGVANGRIIPLANDIPIHAGRRVDATVMFLDICKFSTRPSSTPADQEALLRVMALFFSEMIRVVEDYNGFVEKNTGDGLMAYFTKDPNSSISSQQRALAAAMTMFAAATHIVNPAIVRSGYDPVDFRICIDHGPITVARVGAAQRFNGIVAIGAAANIACKMLVEAGTNDILLGEDVLPGLPAAWVEAHVSLQKEDTGWTVTPSGDPYRFWRYDGRWTLPT
jgi:adenylate cyclase